MPEISQQKIVSKTVKSITSPFFFWFIKFKTKVSSYIKIAVKKFAKQKKESKEKKMKQTA